VRKVSFSFAKIGKLNPQELRLMREELVGKQWFRHQTERFAESKNWFIPLLTSQGEDGEKLNNNELPFLPCIHSEGFEETLKIRDSFGITPLRTRFMKIEAGGEVPEHYDFGWHDKIRMHIPIYTHESVIFNCGIESRHMEAGEIWLIDNDDLHSVKNPSNRDRIHLVIDVFIKEIQNLGKVTIQNQ